MNCALFIDKVATHSLSVDTLLMWNSFGLTSLNHEVHYEHSKLPTFICLTLRLVYCEGNHYLWNSLPPVYKFMHCVRYNVQFECRCNTKYTMPRANQNRIVSSFLEPARVSRWSWGALNCFLKIEIGKFKEELHVPTRLLRRTQRPEHNLSSGWLLEVTWHADLIRFQKGTVRRVQIWNR